MFVLVCVLDIHSQVYLSLYKLTGCYIINLPITDKHNYNTRASRGQLGLVVFNYFELKFWYREYISHIILYEFIKEDVLTDYQSTYSKNYDVV